MDSRSRTTAGRVYEDFVPLHDLRAVEGAVPTLVVRLPGFKKEQIRVQIDNRGKLTISGERPLANNRWSRFRREFQTPEDCNPSEVRAKFENEVLEVMLPKLIREPIQRRKPPPQKPEESKEPTSVAKPSTAQDDTKPKAPAEPINGAAGKKQEEEEEKKKGEQIEERKVSQKVEEREEEQRKDEKHKEKVAEDVDEEGKKGDHAVARVAKRKPASDQAATGGVRNGVRRKMAELGLAFYKPRHPMVNAVAAVLVALVGVGVYLYYKLGRTMEKGGH